MALAYDAWPAPPEGKARSTFERLKQYLREPDDSEYRSLVREYQKLAESHRSSTHIQLALGVLYATGPDLNPPGVSGYRNGVKLHLALADDNAARALSRVAKDDPSQWLAPALLTGIAVSTREKARIRQAAELVENALQHDPDNVAMQLAWSDLLVAQDREDEAVAFWGEHTPVCASELHAEAEALLLTGDSTGAQLYLDALHRAGPDELSRFYDDARVIFGPEDARAWASTAPEHRAGWLALFWERSAAKSGN
jgi:tetratricopeptide (TPR) repeat protein